MPLFTSPGLISNVPASTSIGYAPDDNAAFLTPGKLRIARYKGRSANHFSAVCTNKFGTILSG